MTKSDEERERVCGYRMPFGKYKGTPLGEIAETDDGLLYLDWAVGAFDAGSARSAIEVFLDDEWVQGEIAAASARDGGFDR